MLKLIMMSLEKKPIEEEDQGVKIKEDGQLAD